MEQKRSAPSFASILGIVAAVVVALVLLGWIIGVVWRLIRLGIAIAVIAVIVYAVVWVVSRARGRSD
jgi:hypothetical protein